MKKKNIGIREFLIRHMVFIAFISFGLLFFIWVVNEYSVFLSESESLREKFQTSQKEMLRSEVNGVVDYVEYMKTQTVRRLKSELRERVYQAINIAMNIYRENLASRSPDEIKKMVKDALRPIRFLKGRGYYFAFSMDGIETLFADRPEMEGVNMLPIKGAEGEYVVKEMIDIVKKQQEGFYQYTWTKPFHEKKGFPKIAFVKYFRPFDWAIGTGEYLDDFTNQIQDMVLERIVSLRFKEEGYFFGSMNRGYPLFTNGKITKGTGNIWDLTDPDGIKIIQEQQTVSKRPGGGFVQYRWKKLGAPNPSPKISFVREIPEWGWTIGAGLYLDTIEKIIKKNKDKLKRELIKKFVTGLCVFAGLSVLILFWAKHVAGKTRKSIKTFESSFKKAATESFKVPTDDLQFLEFSRIAKSANRMIDLQKQSENALRESEKKFSEVFRLSPNAFSLSCISDGKIIEINEGFTKMFGYTRQDVKGKTSAEQNIWINESEREKAINKLTADGKLENEDTRYRTKEGKIIDAQISSVIIEGKNEPVILSEIMDVTQSKKAKMELKKSKLFLDNMSDIAYRADDQGNLAWINLSGERIIGLSRKDLIGKPFFPLFIEPDHAAVIDVYKKTLMGESLASTLTFKSGVTCHLTSLPNRNANGDIVGIFGVARDITAQINAQKALRTSEARLKRAQETAKIGSWEYDVSTGRVWGSEESFRIYGIERTSEYLPLDEVEGLIIEARRVNQALVDLIAKGEDYDIEFQITQKNSQEFITIHSIAELIKDEEGNPVKVIGVIQDITEKKAKEKEHNKLLGKLQEAQKMESIGNLAGGIAHDFNNILFPIVGMSELLLEDLSPGSPEHESVQEILKAGKRGSGLVKQILAFSRQTEHKMMPIRAQQVLKEVVKLARSTIPSDIKVSQYLQSDCGMVIADPTQVHQIAMNLITNAYHAVEHTGGKISIKLKEIDLGCDDLPGSSLEPGRYAMLTVSDTGSGINPDTMDKIFEPYFTTKGQGKGTGLGLAVVYGIIKEHGGDIRVYSEPGKGTTFNIYLPIAVQQVEQASRKTVDIHQTGTERILLVDDEEAIVRLEKQMLERLGYRVTIRMNSLKALEAFKANPEAYDLFMTDMTMPNMTGDQLAKEIIRIKPGMPVIICTGFSERVDQEKANAIGVKGFLLKPIIKSEMAQMVRKALDEAKQ